MTSHPFEGLAPRDKLPATARVLDTWINQAQDKVGITAGRIGWLVASSVVIAALQRTRHVDNRPRFLLKGGTYLELKLGLEARATKDVDTLFRGNFEEFVETLDAALADPWGVVELSRSEITLVEGAKRLVKPRRFKVKLSVKGRVWRSIDVELAAEEGAAGTDVAVLPGAPLDHFGLPSPLELAAIVLEYQVAQKLHACTDPHDPPAAVNDRARDIIDLVLLKRAFFDTPMLPTLHAACVDIFDTRATEAEMPGEPARTWPPTVVAHSHWRHDYEALASPLLPDVTLTAAVDELNLWIAQIDNTD